ncbi:MAG: hypothetical protein KIH08_07530 [Candidatus Freyarchaeota archaeon]|nr:hypothetical protein [Candidatus Jordarchaeia archaeon]MBS7270414.1 hypothetical protein [Candidatus Jordarchaeia archaeon]
MGKSRVSKIFMLLVVALILSILPSMMAITMQTWNQLENMETQAVVTLNSAFTTLPVKAGGEVSTWITQTVDSAGGVSAGSSLAFDSSEDNPAISYSYPYNYDLMKHVPQYSFTVEIGQGLNQPVNPPTQMGVELSLNLSAPASLRIIRIMKNVRGGAPPGLAFLGRFVSITANDTEAVQGINIKIHYTDQEVVENSLNETSLAIWYWNETSEKWMETPSTVDTKNNIITTQVNHLTHFAILGTPPSPVTPIALILPLILSYIAQPHSPTDALFYMVKPYINVTSTLLYMAKLNIDLFMAGLNINIALFMAKLNIDLFMAGLNINIALFMAKLNIDLFMAGLNINIALFMAKLNIDIALFSYMVQPHDFNIAGVGIVFVVVVSALIALRLRRRSHRGGEGDDQEYINGYGESIIDEYEESIIDEYGEIVRR